jgi:hypothetical protein
MSELLASNYHNPEGDEGYTVALDGDIDKGITMTVTFPSLDYLADALAGSQLGVDVGKSILKSMGAFA